MARVKLSEYSAKKLLVDNYDGIKLVLDDPEGADIQLSDSTNYVVKVDQGIKKRAKQGLLKLDVPANEVKPAALELSQKGFSKFVIEPMSKHQQSEERYLSFERTRDGILISYSEHGGVDIEEHAQEVVSWLAHETKQTLDVDEKFINQILKTMDTEHLSFVEINPLVITDGKYHLLDAAVLADSAASHLTAWDDSDVVQAEKKHPAELAVDALQASSPSSFSLKILDPNGALWLLLSGGGASITLADEAANHGRAELIGNYGEYSGGPTSQETYLYTRQLISCLLQSSAPKKALVIAGGVANFTDVRKTFSGVIKALDDVIDELKASQVKVFVRRGGPHEKEGLAIMRQFLDQHGLLGSIHGSDQVLTVVINEALEFIDA